MFADTYRDGIIHSGPMFLIYVHTCVYSTVTVQSKKKKLVPSTASHPGLLAVHTTEEACTRLLPITIVRTLKRHTLHIHKLCHMLPLLDIRTCVFTSMDKIVILHLAVFFHMRSA